MKFIHKLTLSALSAILLNLSAGFGAIVIPGADGSDGALNITSNTVIDLSRAITGNWDASNTNNAGKGIYDSNKWAVVFKYTSVTVAANATVTFKNHASRAPVVWLVSGHVTVSGSVSLAGENWAWGSRLPEGGPGGFRGGVGNMGLGVADGAGFGPGGGGLDGHGTAGSYGSVGAGGSSTYGNPSLLPLIGGSGGGGDRDYGASSGAGGGAILVACSGTLSIHGTILANGGDGFWNTPHTGGGSGGGIRLVCSTLSGNGTVGAMGGSSARPGGLGRIRIERVTKSEDGDLQVTPDPSVVTLQAGATPLIWLPNDGPTARIVSIGASGNTNAPADPRASFGTFGADVTLPQVSTTPVIIETANAETASVVTVRVTPRANGSYSETAATVTQTNSTSPLVLRWLANIPVNPGYSAVQVKVVRP